MLTPRRVHLGLIAILATLLGGIAPLMANPASSDPQISVLIETSPHCLISSPFPLFGLGCEVIGAGTSATLWPNQLAFRTSIHQVTIWKTVDKNLGTHSTQSLKAALVGIETPAIAPLDLLGATALKFGLDLSRGVATVTDPTNEHLSSRRLVWGWSPSADWEAPVRQNLHAYIRLRQFRTFGAHDKILNISTASAGLSLALR